MCIVTETECNVAAWSDVVRDTDKNHVSINLLAPEFLKFFLAHSVCKM
jgi:hypothetical protein